MINNSPRDQIIFAQIFKLHLDNEMFKVIQFFYLTNINKIIFKLKKIYIILGHSILGLRFRYL